MPWYLSKESCMDTHPQDYCWNDHLRSLTENGWDKVPNKESLFLHRAKGLCLSVYVDEIKNGLTETHVGHIHQNKLIKENRQP